MTKPEVTLYRRPPWVWSCFDCDSRGEHWTRRDAETAKAQHRRECLAHVVCECGHSALQHSDGEFGTGYCSYVDYSTEEEKSCECKLSQHEVVEQQEARARLDDEVAAAERLERHTHAMRRT